jgi:hypothetical protein
MRSAMLSSSAELVKRDKKSVVAMILYAEFTAKPGSEAEVGKLISGLAEDVRREPGNTEFTVYLSTENEIIRVSSSSSSSIETKQASTPTSAPSTV